MNRGGHTLQQDFNIYTVPVSPPVTIQNEHHLQTDVLNRQVIPFVRRAIAASHADMWVFDGNVWPGNSTEGKPDISFISWDGPDGEERDMIFPVEVKLSANWKSVWRTSTVPEKLAEYKQVLAQIRFYMDLFERRWGGVLTDTELVVVKRLGHYGDIEVSQSIPYSACDVAGNFTLSHGTPTIALTLWCMATRTDYYLESKALSQGDSDSEGVDEDVSVYRETD